MQVSGPFLSIPMLRRAWPAGLDTLEPPMRARLRAEHADYFDVSAAARNRDDWIRYAPRICSGGAIGDVWPGNTRTADAGSSRARRSCHPVVRAYRPRWRVPFAWPHLRRFADRAGHWVELGRVASRPTRPHDAPERCAAWPGDRWPVLGYSSGHHTARRPLKRRSMRVCGGRNLTYYGPSFRSFAEHVSLAYPMTRALPALFAQSQDNAEEYNRSAGQSGSPRGGVANRSDRPG